MIAPKRDPETEPRVAEMRAEPGVAIHDPWTRRLVELQRALIGAPPSANLLDLVLPSIGKALEAARVTWLDVDLGPQGWLGRARFAWTPRSVAHDEDGLSVEAIPPRWMALLRVGAVVDVTPDGLSEAGPSARPVEGRVLALPVELQGALRAVIRIESSGTRVRNPVELLFARDAARSLATAIARQQHERTERQQMQSRLLLADRMVTIGALAAGVAHEINNPLTFTLANLEYVHEELDRSLAAGDLDRVASLGAVLSEATEGALRVQRIVTQLKKLSRRDDAEVPAPVELRAVIETALLMAGNQIRHRARLEKRFERVPLVWAQEARLGQVFINLFVNAAQAIAEGSAERNRIVVATGVDESGRVYVDVTDSGGGVPDEIRDRIFEPFFTTKPAGIGTGLGLAICQEILRDVGGDIVLAASRPGETTFRVALAPAPGDGNAQPTVRTSLPPSGVTPARVLVVDDEPAVGNSVRRLLRGHHVEVVTDGTHALGLLAAGRDYDVVLCDLMMPEFDGTQVYEAVRRVRPEALDRFVFLTGGAFTARARAFLDAVPNPTLAKPFDARVLRRLVEERAPRPEGESPTPAP